MRWTDIQVTALAASLGRRERTADAVAEGRYTAEENEADGYLAVRVADKGPAVELAVGAANLAIARTRPDTPPFGLVVHSSWAHQGMDNFTPASYVQSRTVQGTAPALEVNQFSNGGLASIEMAAAYLTASPTPISALITTSDRFVLPAYDRYRSDQGMVLGDGGTALILSRGSGVARLLSTSIISDTTFHDLYMGDEAWTEAPGENGWPIDLRARKAQYIGRHGEDIFYDLVRNITSRQQQNIEAALADARLDKADITRWVFPHTGRSLGDWEWRKSMGITEASTTWDWAREVGHLGPGDQIGGLTHLIETSQVHVGDRVAMIGIGAGFTFGCVIVEITAEPDWTVSTNDHD
jgi:3-oxoacyl-[acyl-carrier-protein] synthase III